MYSGEEERKGEGETPERGEAEIVFKLHNKLENIKSQLLATTWMLHAC